ncbi:hypothetical protein [Sulfurimonas sp.]
MKKIVMILMMAAAMLLVSGCSSTDKAYTVGKKLYVGGKAAVEANADSFSDETLNKLRKVDTVAEAYDNTRTKVRQVIGTQENK